MLEDEMTIIRYRSQFAQIMIGDSSRFLFSMTADVSSGEFISNEITYSFSKCISKDISMNIFTFSSCKYTAYKFYWTHYNVY
ncbi:hypothetical protein AQUCO_00200503v1 [Aquilegia coerulea]|uniref:Uncharacterized protein n=1 Tax=Aquilegia coerulea TaxID=218851 RepID=A0A2G5F3K6_AQUCA|nr:hypothetical protein AQUCO_00200503v1 [Aquilegia coerulea]